jgi:hypothetical protein
MGNPNEREITSHHDGHGLNESIRIVADEPGPGGASHHYKISIHVDSTADRPGGLLEVATIQFQKGPRNVEGSEPGIVESVLLAIVRDRLEAFNAGEYRCRQNAVAITKTEEAMHWLRDRADERARRGVLGSYQK